MTPVAYDHASASTIPQIPRSKKLILQSLYFGLTHTALALIVIFSLNHRGVQNVDLNQSCDTQTKGFVWFYLVLVTELSIFSVRAPSYFWRSMPSMTLIISVLLTCVIGAIIAIFASDLQLNNMGYIILYNVVAFIMVDLGKVPFRKLINEDPGEDIVSDDLIEVVEKSEITKYTEKQKRYRVHRDSILDPSDVEHVVRIREESIMSGFFGDLSVSDGFLASIRPPHIRKNTLSTPAGLRH